jgi:hypothetical protein
VDDAAVWERFGFNVTVRFCVFWRHDEKSSWREYAIESSEHNARGVASDFKREHPERLVEVRKVTTIEERIRP